MVKFVLCLLPLLRSATASSALAQTLEALAVLANLTRLKVGKDKVEVEVEVVEVKVALNERVGLIAEARDNMGEANLIVDCLIFESEKEDCGEVVVKGSKKTEGRNFETASLDKNFAYNNANAF